MTFRLIIVWLLAWTPYAMLCFVGFFLDSEKLTPTVGLVPLVSCKISAAANVMLYGLRFVAKCPTNFTRQCSFNINSRKEEIRDL